MVDVIKNYLRKNGNGAGLADYLSDYGDRRYKGFYCAARSDWRTGIIEYAKTRYYFYVLGSEITVERVI